MKDESVTTGRVIGMKEKRELAQLLYVSGACQHQLEVAERVGVSKVSINKWAQADKWDEKKRSLLTIRSNQLSRMYLLLEYYVSKVEDKVKRFKEMQEDKDASPAEKSAADDINTKDTDVIVKLTGAIKNLEIELSVAEVVDVLTKYNEYIRKVSPEKLKAEVELQDGYVKTLI
jgi:hypothetical protein